jgi:hypothetical protein
MLHCSPVAHEFKPWRGFTLATAEARGVWQAVTVREQHKAVVRLGKRRPHIIPPMTCMCPSPWHSSELQTKPAMQGEPLPCTTTTPKSCPSQLGQHRNISSPRSSFALLISITLSSVICPPVSLIVSTNSGVLLSASPTTPSKRTHTDLSGVATGARCR